MSLAVLDKYVAQIRAGVGKDDWCMVKERLIELVGDVAGSIPMKALQVRYGRVGPWPSKLPSTLVNEEEDDEAGFMFVPEYMYCVAEMPSMAELLGDDCLEDGRTLPLDPYGRSRRERITIDYCNNSV